MKKVKDAVALNQTDAYVIGSLIVKKALSKATAVPLAKSYQTSAKKLVSLGVFKKVKSNFWIPK